MNAAEPARLFVEPPFVGRQTELGLLARACEDALGGRGGVVLVAGEAGIGKTRTVTEAAGLARGFEVLWGRCRAMEGAPPYWPWVQIAGAMRSVGSEGMAGLFDAVATDSARPGRAGAADGVAAEADPAQRRFRFFHSVASFLRQTSENTPLLLLLEDLHWADSESLQLASFVADEIRDRPILLVGTHRPLTAAAAGSTRQFFSQLLQKARRLDLVPFDRGEVDRVVAVCVGELPEAIVERIFALTEGNPFFLRELAGLFVGGRDPSTVTLPEHIRDTVQQRLALLPAEPRRILGIAAVAGREFDPKQVAAVAACGVDQVREALDVAAEHGVVVVAGPRRVRFAHALIQAVLYGDEPRGSRASIHRRLAEELSRGADRDSDGRDDAIAHHFFAAEDADSLDKGAAAALRAGDQARAALGYEVAARLYERVLEVYAGADAGRQGRRRLRDGCRQTGGATRRRDRRGRCDRRAGVQRPAQCGAAAPGRLLGRRLRGRGRSHQAPKGTRVPAPALARAGPRVPCFGTGRDERRRHRGRLRGNRGRHGP